ncbi:MAG: hypothetical protein M3467_09385 [Actinomycetota bacterium]|nr:hypothetical protein [Actinomycetota bacterium]
MTAGGVVPYFAALVARTSDGWEGRNLDLDGLTDMGTLAETMAAVADVDEPVLLLVEQEDEWFAVARVDGDADLRLFVSHPTAVAAGWAGALLVPDLAAADPPEESSGAPGPDLDLLDDLGMPAEELLEMVDEELLPADALGAVAERAGCADLVDELR